MYKLNILACVLILVNHANIASAVDPPKAPMVLKEGRKAIHPGPSIQVAPKDPAPIPPPHPTVYNAKVAAAPTVHDLAPPPPPPHVYNANVPGDKIIPNPTPTASAAVLHQPDPLHHVDTHPHVTGPQVHPQPHPLPPQPTKVVPSAVPYGPQQPNPQTQPKATSGQVAPPYNKGDTNSLSFSSSSSSADGPGGRQCSFTVSNPNTFHASSDNFGYPKFMVEGAANKNPLALQIFQKYSEQKNSGTHFPISGEASRPASIGLGTRHIPAFNFGGPQPTDGQDLDVDAMFNKIGKHATDDGLGTFPHETPGFPNPDKYINPGRKFGPGSSLRSSFQKQNPFAFGNLFFRKKRAAINNLGLGQGFKNQLQTVCPSTRDYIRVFRKYNSACYLYKPELQGRKVAKCTQKKCSHCGGSGRCVEEQESAMVWAYCQSGPNARKLELEYIEYPAYCVCKTIEC